MIDEKGVGKGHMNPAIGVSPEHRRCARCGQQFCKCKLLADNPGKYMLNELLHELEVLKADNARMMGVLVRVADECTDTVEHCSKCVLKPSACSSAWAKEALKEGK